ncbi:DUF853 domain-containing protein, partial [Nocardia salmonicida]
MTVVEEAHRLLKRAEPGSPAEHGVELFAGLLAEIRAYGEGIIVAEQIPVKIAPDVVKNTALKIMHRLPAADDREFVGAAMNLDDAQSRHVVSMAPGEAAVFADRMDRPIRVRVPHGEARESSLGARGNARICGTESVLTLNTLETAREVSEDPRIVLWIELLVMAHLTGSKSPVPDSQWLMKISAGTEEKGVLDEAIAHRIRVAIDDRYAGLAAHYQPESLADHLQDSVNATFRHNRSCTGTEVDWQAGRFRWADILRTLRRSSPTSTDGQHPLTDVWERRGISLPGGNPMAQLAELRKHPDCWLPPRSVVLGPGDPTRFMHALSKVSRNSSLTERLQEGTRYLRISDSWPEQILRPLLE